VSLNLAARAGEFGEELQQLLDAVLPYQKDTDPDLRQVTVTESGLAFAVEIGTAKAGEPQAIPLLSAETKVAELVVSMRLVADSADRHPAVSRSRMVVRVDRRNPLLRLDYKKDMHTVPGCHWNVHAERSALTRVLARSNPDHNGELSKIHLPVGGFRMRPSIEDVLQMLITDFRFDSLAGAQAAIAAGRVRWRRRQLAAMIRDDAPEAIRVMEEELGYKVTIPDGVPSRATRFDRLHNW
jgi:hypothetical protein